MTALDTHRDVQRIVDSGVVAVLRGADAGTVIEVVEALREGGVTAVEITADTPGAMGMIGEVSGSFGDEVVIGAGTVLDAETARSALLSGAEFVVSPTLDEGVVRTCNRYGVVTAPGVFTPTEALRGYELGADVVKVFPASTGGPSHVKGIKGPLPQIPIMPTGGIDLDNAADFIEAGAEVVGAGSALVDDEAVEAGAFDEVTETARKFTETIDAARE
ncbi:bifunctional 4-hydroxy-2-oxoglutarate aldolase/2-dehydro-3-deoxy-phosphogluconate aldolase [Halegenticoccus tardaugens]|uniref:bifunctional 4-hydroxy-2-oxoglutarate aldolase/2-dehydro-3-deoxy-phosphogluconate aldolase n=1 Tax=Halegenticoccus tardaugens TaxID=2071624 RepID=UPI00100B18E8|nr:bifunctional 4-hydroxy-2-oxoglutarate aldolase/2-dehydro-3-deoxy-phosphogluconate aldolase [Halegenticoccus tardaugens]